MKNVIRYSAITAIALVLLTAESCKKKSVTDKINSNQPTFSLDAFETELTSSITPSGAIGWTYIINQNGLYARGKAFGKARNDADGGDAMTLNKKINIASVSKFMTAIAVMQLLEKRNLQPTEKIEGWLPNNWALGNGVANLTFHDLLSHASGLGSVNTNFDSTLRYSALRKMISTGVVKPGKPYEYLNANYALFRILIPGLWKGLPGAPALTFLDSPTTEQAYMQYMQQNVFEPIGLNGINCTPEARATATLYYATTDMQVFSGTWYSEWADIAGGGGFFMTSMELARALAYYRHTNVLLTNTYRNMMENARYGFEGKDDELEKHGTYLPKNGSISNTKKQGTYEQIVLFPNGVEVVVMFNTQGMVFAGGETSIRRSIYDAYNKSWK